MKNDIIKIALKNALEWQRGNELQYYSSVTGLSKTELSEAKRGTRSLGIEKAIIILQAYGVFDDFMQNLKNEAVKVKNNLPY